MTVRQQDAEENLSLSAKLRARLGLEERRAGSYDELRARLGLGEPDIRSSRRQESSLRRRVERRIRRGGEVGKTGERNRGLIVLGLVAIVLMAAARYLEYKNT